MTTCRECGAVSELPGWDWCNLCSSRNGAGIPLGAVADAIVQFDQAGVEEGDRQTFFKVFGIPLRAVQAAQEVVESRYQAARLPRRRYRGW